ncbi:MAG: short chain dehydrogenase [Bacteroidetes bacterium 4572_77]|nr:MAG: short chain dehydrogenase [Bacteroidetes bacterium 4572_77]
MNNYYKNKVVWITGASSGIGRALCLAFAQNGAQLIISSRKEKELEKLQNECHGFNATCMVIPLDLSQSTDFIKKTTSVIDRFEKIDFLFLNGGISQRSYAKDTPLEIDRQLMEVNYFGNVALAKAVLPYMIKENAGHIAVTSSIVGAFGFALRSTYSASKHALHGFFESLRAEHYQNNIKVSIIIPGRVNTQISLNALTQNGEAYGKLDQGQANGISAEKAAQIILKGIKKEKKEIMVGGKEIWMVYLRRYLPFVFYKIANKVKKK